MTARLRADPYYSGFTCKNPLHRSWTTLWGDHPYTLGELHGWLGDLNQYTLPQRTVGVGRNVETFDAVRAWAYRLVLPHKADGGTRRRGAWPAPALRTSSPAITTRRCCTDSECRWIGASVAKWTWRKLTPEGLRAWHVERGRAGGKRSKRGYLSETQPWEREGVSRATWYRVGRA